jgi:uncharacterized ParB-like nuclease family protein
VIRTKSGKCVGWARMDGLDETIARAGELVPFDVLLKTLDRDRASRHS